jgi:short-subunit dehydrogenase
MHIQNKKALVTGGTSGLGFALAKKLVEKGAFVYILGRDQKKLQEAVTTISKTKTAAILADISNHTEVEKSLSGLSVNILINNAGVWLEGELTDNSYNTINYTIDTNLKGTIYTTKALLPALLKETEAHIVNISSTSGLKIRNGQSVYAASKAGVTSFTRCLEMDLAKTNVKVTAIHPGGMKTPLFEKAGNQKEIEDWMDPNKVADLIINLIEQDESMVTSSLEINKRHTKFSNS